MKKQLAFILILSFIVSSYSNQNSKHLTFLQKESRRDNTEQKRGILEMTNDSDDVRLIAKLHPLWFNYYFEKISDADLDKFKLTKEWKISIFETGNIFGDFDKEFNNNHLPYIIESPDKTEYIDLDSYKYSIEKNEKDQLFCSGGEIDQEVNWVSRKTKEIKRVSFSGPDSWFEDAKWLDDSKIVLFGVSFNRLTFEIIDLKARYAKLFQYPETTFGKFDYNEEIRLKNVNFK